MLDNTKVNLFRQSVTTRYNLLLAVTFLALFFFFLRPPTDPDLGWHLRYGQQMWETRQIPRTDTFSSTMTGYAWADSYWLSEVFIYGLFSLGGYYLLALVFSLIASLAAVLTFSSFRKTPLRSGSLDLKGVDSSFWGEGVNLVLSLFLAVLLIISFAGTRPQTISLLFFAMILLLLRYHRYRFLPLLFLFWANFHAGFVLGLALVWLWFVGEILGNLRIRELGNRRKLFGLVTRLTKYPIICTIITLLNPYGPFLWHSIARDAGSVEIKQYIAEWAPPLLRSDLGLLFFLYLVVFLILLGLNFRREKLSFLLPALFFTFLSLSALRHIPLFVILTLPFFYQSLPRLSYSGTKYTFIWILLVFLIVSVFSFAGFLVPIVNGEWTSRQTKGFGNYPEAAAAYLKNNPVPGVIFNTYGWGGYFLWNVPEYKTFIDGRMPGWRTGSQPTLFSEYLQAAHLKNGWAEVLEKYKIASVVIDKTVPLSEALRIKTGWEKVYEDSLAVIFRRVN